MGANYQLMLKASAGNEAFLTAGAIALVQDVVRITNEGGDGAPPAAIDTGELRGSPRVTINAPSAETSDGPGPLTSPSDVSRAVQLGGFAIGDTIFARWIADHANIIEGGRRASATGGMIGSEQNPDGFLQPAIDVGVSRMDRWRYDP